MHSLSIVIPAYNEEGTIYRVVAQALEAAQKNFTKYEVILLNDGSTDNTDNIIQQIQKRHPTIIKTIHHKKRRGISDSFEHLFSLARMDFILDLSADGQVCPTEIISKIKPLLNQYDIIVCRRKDKHYGLYRSVVSAGYRYLPKWLFGIDLYDPGCAKCTRRAIRQNIPTVSKGIFKEAERCLRAIQQHSCKLTTVTINIIPTSKRGQGAKFLLVFAALTDLTRFWLALRFNNRKARTQ
jgi:glycosyltransferase involved in cell wall biosynthesis